MNYKKNKLNIHNISPCVEIMQNVKTAQSASNTSVTKITFFLYERSRRQLRYLIASKF